MDKFAILTILLLGALALVAAEPLEAGWCPSPGGGGGSGPARPSGPGSGGGSPGPARPTPGTRLTASEFGGSIKWINSNGTGSPVATGVPTEEAKEEDADIYELSKATEEMKPILAWYDKPKDLLAFGKKQTKDPEVEACDEMSKDLWKRWVITELAKEFVCVRVNTRKSDQALLRKHRVARAPVVEILDFNLKPIYFSSSPRLKHSSLAKVMDRCRKKVEDAVKKLAKSDEDTPLVQRAKMRAQVIETREEYDKGTVALGKRNWNKAADAFNKGIAIEQDSEWKKKCQIGLLEIKAGKLYVEAERLYKMRQFQSCKDRLDTIMSDYKEAKYFAGLAKEMLTKVNKKVGGK